MNKKLIVIVFLLWSLAYCAFGQANQWGPFDPGALRNDGSNASSAATVRDNLGLGTMATEAATDYVATDTFTGHTGATGASVHGLGTISTFASTDYVATSSLAERLDTVNASFTGDIDVTGDVGAATVNGVAPLTAAEKTQALVGLSTIDHYSDTLYTTAVSIATGTPREFKLTGLSTNVNNDATVSLAFFKVIADDCGTIYVANRTNDQHAKFFYYGTTVVEEQDPSANFSPTKDNAGTINVYIESEAIVLQNKDGAVRAVKLTAVGYSTSQ